MSDTVELLKTVYGSRIPYDNELDWLKTQGADADEISIGNAWRTVLDANGYWVGNPADSVVNWLQDVTGLTSRDTGYLITYALENDLYGFKYYDFDGIGDYVEFGTSFNSTIAGAGKRTFVFRGIPEDQASSVAMWGMYAGGGNQRGFIFGVNTSDNPYLAISSNGITVSGYIATSITISYGVYLDLRAVFYPSDKIEFWVNGVLAETVGSVTETSIFNSSDQLRLGQQSVGFGDGKGYYSLKCQILDENDDIILSADNANASLKGDTSIVIL